MNLLKNLPILLLLLFLFKNSSAQEPSYFQIGERDFNNVHLYSIIQDNDQTMWISSSQGLYNYDGKSFNRIKMTSTQKRGLFGLTKDNYGSVYCFDFSGQIYKVVNKELQPYFLLPKKNLGNNLEITFNKRNHLIIISGGKLYIKGDDDLLRTYDTSYLYSSLMKDNKGQVFITRQKKNTPNVNEVIKLSESSAQLIVSSKQIIPNHRFFKYGTSFFYVDRHKASIFELNSQTNNIQEYKIRTKEAKFFSGLMYYLTRGRVWIAPEKNGICCVSIKHIGQNMTNAERWFKNYYISGVYQDNEGNIWLLTFNNGILIIPNIKVTSINLNNSLSNEKLTSIRKVNNQLYVGTSDGNVYEYKNKTFKTFLKLSSRINYLNIFGNGYTVVSSGLLNMAKKEVMPLSNAKSAVQANDSIIAVSTSSSLFTINTNTLKTNNIHKGRTNHLFYDKKLNEYWYSTIFGIKVRGSNQKEQSILDEHGQPLIAGNTTAIGDEKWVCASKGIYIYKNRQLVRKITIKDGLLSNQAYKIVYDSPYVYISSNKGIQRLDLKSGSYKNCTQADGLYGAPIDFDVIDGDVYVLSYNKLHTFTFDKIHKRTAHYKTSITDVISNGSNTVKEYDKLKPEQHNIEFSFFTISYSNQKNISYSYKLEGLDQEWTKAKDKQTFVKYSNLQPGNYTFIVKSSINNIENPPATFSFSIKQYWYKSFWFGSILTLCAMGIIYYFYKENSKKRSIKQKQQQLEKKVAESSMSSLKAQMNPHFLFNTINGIQSLILTEKPLEAYKYLNKLSQLIRDNLDMSNETFVALEVEINLIKMYLELEKLRFHDSFDYTINNEIAESDCTIPAMVVQPFVENAVKHGLFHKSGQKVLKVTFFKENDLIKCIIEDNGIGRAAAQEISKNRNHKSFATGAIKKRFEILKEYYQYKVGFEYEDLYQEGAPAGTRVTINLINFKNGI